MNKNTSVGNFTRGGQITTHQMRMFGQGLRASMLFGAASATVWGLWRIYQHLSLEDLYHWSVCQWAEIKLEFLQFFTGKEALWKTNITFYHFGYKNWFTIKAFAYLNWPALKRCILRVHEGCDFIFSFSFLSELFIAFCLGIAVSIIIFAHKGLKKRQSKFERGGDLVSSSSLANVLRRKRQASDIAFDGLPLVKNSETLHMMFSGTTGSGKTNALHKLLPQIRAKGQKAIIVDLNGAFVSNYYREGMDTILNPLDRRTKLWSPWADCQTTSQYDAFAEAMIPSGAFGSDKFWEQASRTVIATTLEELQASKRTSIFCQTLLGSDIKTLAAFFKKTAAAYLIGEATDKMSPSILATLSNYIKCLLYVQDTEVPFSIRDWLRQEDESWLFLTAAPDQRATLKPLLTTCLDIAFNGLMSLEHEKGYDLNRRVWFILDELPALQKVPSLQTALAESRKFGGCIVAGIQNIHQLQKIYGQSESQAIMNLFNTSFIFRTDDPETCQYLSSKLGEQELHDVQENISYGANTMRDGVALNIHQKRHTLVLPTEISLLPNLECYVKYPGTWAITKLKMKLEKPTQVAPAFQIHEVKTKITYEEKVSPSEPSSLNEKNDNETLPETVRDEETEQLKDKEMVNV